MDVRLALKEYRQFTRRTLEILSHIPDAYISPRVMRAWEEGGLLVPAWHKNGTLTRTWISVVAHNAAVGLMAYWLAKRLGHLLRGNP